MREAILKKASKGDLPVTAAAKPERKRKRWDQHTPSHDEEGGGTKKKSAWDQAEVCALFPLHLSLSNFETILHKK